MKFPTPISRLAALALFSLAMLAGCDTGQVSQPQPTSTTIQAQGAATIGTSTTPTGTEPPASSANIDPNLASALATATVLAGMAPADSSTAKSIDVSKVDVCGMLTRAEIEAVMGPAEYKPAARTFPVQDEVGCNFMQEHNQDDGTVKGQQLDVVLWSSHYWTMQRGLYDNATPVAGIGAEAFTLDSGGWQTLFVRVPDKALVEVHIFPKDLENAKKLALAVIGKLP